MGNDKSRREHIKRILYEKKEPYVLVGRVEKKYI